MKPSNELERARVWMNQGRVDRAESELRRALAEDPEDSTAHAFLSLCLTDLDRAAEATEEARLAISRAPDFPLAHYALAASYLARGRAAEARPALAEALRLDPNDADCWSLQGRIELVEHNWSEAVAAAEKGLALDAEHVGCANVRATGLAQRGDASASAAMVRQALARDPENSETHTVAGWARLQQGDMAEAGRHFSEALRIDPNEEGARSGLLEVLKARNVVYRTMLRFFVWMGRQSKRTVWIVVIGLWIAPRALRSLAAKNPELQPLLYPIVGLMIGFIYLTWVVDPVFDAMLFLHPLGRHALKPRERAKAIAVVICLGVALLCVLLALSTGVYGLFFPVVLLLLYVIPLNVAFEANERHRRAATGAAIGLGLVGLALMAIGFVTFVFVDDPTLDGTGTSIAGLLFLAYLVGVMVLSFVSLRWSLDPRTD